MTEPIQSPINLIRETFSHMGIHSGYDVLFSQIAKKIPARSIFVDHQTPVAKWKSIYWRLTKRDLSGLTPSLYHATERLQQKLLTGTYQNEIFHFAYWESNFRKLNNSGFSRKNTLIATQHQPAGWYKLMGLNPGKMVEPLSRLIVLSSETKDFFSDFMPERVHFIPHGVDTHFFSPGTNKKNTFRILFVGQWLRNFNLLKLVIEKVCRTHQDIYFDLVIPRSKRSFDLMEIARFPQVRFYENLSDTELLALYQNASALFLPLIDSTANNAILEAMSCGLPILTTDSGGAADYCSPEYGFVSRSDPDFFHDSIQRLFHSDDLRNKMGTEARLAAISQFDWDMISEKVIKIYDGARQEMK